MMHTKIRNWKIVKRKLLKSLSKRNLWDRLLLSFRAVAPTALFISPIFINSKTSAVDLTGCMLASGTANPLGWVEFQIPSVWKSKETMKNALYIWLLQTDKYIYRETHGKYHLKMNISQQLWKDIFFESCRWIINHALAHYISQPFEHQLHM